MSAPDLPIPWSDMEEHFRHDGIGPGPALMGFNACANDRAAAICARLDLRGGIPRLVGVPAQGGEQ